MLTLPKTAFEFAGLKSRYEGKVRDVYSFTDNVALVATDRISAFDHVLPASIPYKGQVLTGIAKYFLDAASDIVPVWLLQNPHPNVSYGLKCEPIKIEMVIRGYLAGHAARLYKKGERNICGVDMPDGMIEGQKFPSPIITPSTKADEGHDEDISGTVIIEQEIVTAEQWQLLCAYTSRLFEQGQEMANERGLILVDTKYEFGIYRGKIYLIDEIHTPDSSRYYIADGYEERQSKGAAQIQLSKEFVREWLMKQGFQGKPGQHMPAIPRSFIKVVSRRYIELYERIVGHSFKPVKPELVDIKESIEACI